MKNHVPGHPLNKGRDRSVAKRWTVFLAKRWVPISTYFLENYHRLRPHPGAKGLSSSEVMCLIHIMTHKWDEDAPFPSQKTLAKKMDVSDRRVRQILTTLKELGYLSWDQRAYNSNLYHLEGLFDALEQLMVKDGLIDKTTREFNKMNEEPLP